MKLGMHCSRFTWPSGPDAMGTTLATIGLLDAMRSVLEDVVEHAQQQLEVQCLRVRIAKVTEHARLIDEQNKSGTVCNLGEARA